MIAVLTVENFSESFAASAAFVDETATVVERIEHTAHLQLNCTCARGVLLLEN
jgi:hypothetical protein